MESLTIGKLAKLTGVNSETIRFYERRGLIPRPPTSSTGYRQYGDKDVGRLVFIRRCIRLGFSLDEIQDLLNAHNDVQNVETVTKQITDRLADLESLYEALKEMIEELSDEASKLDILERLMRFQRWREGPEAFDTEN